MIKKVHSIIVTRIRFKHILVSSNALIITTYLQDYLGQVSFVNTFYNKCYTKHLNTK